MKAVTLICDACGLPIGPEIPPIPIVREQRNDFEQMLLGRMFGPATMHVEEPPAPGEITVKAEHLHPECRDALNRCLAKAVEVLRERALSDTAQLRAAFNREEHRR